MGFFGGALGIESDEASEDLLVTQICGPAVGCSHGCIDIIVELAEDGNESLIVDRLFLGRKGTTFPERFQNIVDPGKGECRMLCLNSLSMGIEFLGKGSNPIFYRVVTLREWKGIKALCLWVDRAILQKRTA